MDIETARTRALLASVLLMAALSPWLAGGAAGTSPEGIVEGCSPETLQNPVEVTDTQINKVDGSPGDQLAAGDRIQVQVTVENQVHPLCRALQTQPTDNVRGQFTYEADQDGETAASGHCNLETQSTCSEITFEVDLVDAPDEEQEILVRVGQQDGGGFEELDRTVIDLTLG